VETEVEMKQAAADLREEAGLPPASTSAAPTEQKDVEMVRHSRNHVQTLPKFFGCLVAYCINPANSCRLAWCLSVCLAVNATPCASDCRFST